MTTREKVLELFETNRGSYFSGEDMAKKLSISRAAVWKAVNSLKKEGYEIHGVPKKGYCLSGETDMLSAQGIRKYLKQEIRDMDISVLPVAVSTNAVMREKAMAGAKDRSLLLANGQTAGRGRLGRSFFSPGDTGIYMSLLLRPEACAAGQAVKLTTMAAVAVCEAIEAVSDQKAEIKWVNDIFVQGKKVSGILTEGSLSLENDWLEYAVLGIGINLYEPKQGFPKELEGIAGAVFQSHQDDGKNRLAGEVLNRFYDYDRKEDTWSYVERYRKRSMVLGKRISILCGAEKKKVQAVGIDDQCRLIVRDEAGVQSCYSSGEISICREKQKEV